MRVSRVTAWSAHISGRLGRRPARRDNQSARHADPRTNPPNESQLPRVQVSADKSASMEQGVSTADAARGHSPGQQAAGVHAVVAHHPA